MSDNTSRRVSSIVSIDLLDPILEAMLDGVFVPGSGGNVSLEFNFIPFLVNESDMDHQWHSGPMDLDFGGEDGEDKEEEEEGEALYGDEDEYEAGEGERGENEEEEAEARYRHHHHHYHHHDYSSQRDYEEDDDDDEEEEDDEEDQDGEANEEEYDYDVGDEDDDEEDIDEDDDEEDDDDEDEDDDDDELRIGFIDDSVIANYGNLGWSICHNISARKILHDTFNSRDFLRQMVEFFYSHLKQSNLSSTASLQLLLSCLPSLVDLKNLISKTRYTMKEAIVIKVVLEMYESYYKTYGAPNFKVYHTEVIPLLLDFYNRLPDAALKLISKQLTRVLLNLQSLYNFKMFHTKQEYIAHYRDSTRRMRNLSECTDPALFLR